jgi:hypothetical protein
MLKTKAFILPAYFALFLVNGDASSLESQEVRDILAFTEKHNLLNCVDCSEQYFSWSNDFDKCGGFVMEFTFNSVG